MSPARCPATSISGIAPSIIGPGIGLGIDPGSGAVAARAITCVILGLIAAVNRVVIAFTGVRLGSRPDITAASRVPVHNPKKNLAGTSGPAKFEQGGFTSTRRRVRRPLSGRKSRKLVWSKFAPRIRSDQVSRGTNIQFRGPGRNRELVLARLQKPQCYQRVAKFVLPRRAGPRKRFSRAGPRPPCAAENRGK